MDVQTEVLPVPLARVLAREAEVRRRLDAYSRARNDREASELLGIAKDAFQAWRLRAGLPAKGERVLTSAGAPAAEVDRWRREVFASARSDRDAAEVLGIVVQSFRGWRSRRGIPPKRPRPARPPSRARASMFCPRDGSLLRGGVCHGCERRREDEVREERRRRGPTSGRPRRGPLADAGRRA